MRMKSTVGTLVASLMLATQPLIGDAIAAGKQGSSSVTSVGLPNATTVQSHALACRTLLATSLFPTSDSRRLEAKASQESDKLAVEIDGTVLRFMTAASVEAGMATGAEFQILQNDGESLAAVDYQVGPLGWSLSTFLLNKQNGLAVWTKSRPSFLTIKEPDTQSFYLVCQ